jgi:hypothetical protein
MFSGVTGSPRSLAGSEDRVGRGEKNRAADDKKNGLVLTMIIIVVYKYKIY